jgi:hypothetical protein
MTVANGSIPYDIPNHVVEPCCGQFKGIMEEKMNKLNPKKQKKYVGVLWIEVLLHKNFGG